MSSGLVATIGVLALVGLFGLIILWDRKKTEQEEAGPTERWDAHVEQLQKRGP